MNTTLIHCHRFQSLMFQDLISLDFNESFASIANPQGIWIKLSIILCWILTPLPRWWCSLTPLYLPFSHAKCTDGVLLLGVYSAYGHHEYLPDLIMAGTHTLSKQKRGNMVCEQLACHSQSILESVKLLV